MGAERTVSDYNYKNSEVYWTEGFSCSTVDDLSVIWTLHGFFSCFVDIKPEANYMRLFGGEEDYWLTVAAVFFGGTANKLKPVSTKTTHNIYLSRTALTSVLSYLDGNWPNTIWKQLKLNAHRRLKPTRSIVRVNDYVITFCLTFYKKKFVQDVGHLA